MGSLQRGELMSKGWKEIPEGGLIVEPHTSLENKTGTWRSFKPVWDPDKCIHCMFCVFYCPDSAIPITKDEKPKRLDTDLNYCKGCGICANVCPTNAIEMVEEGDE